MIEFTRKDVTAAIVANEIANDMIENSKSTLSLQDKKNYNRNYGFQFKDWTEMNYLIAEELKGRTAILEEAGFAIQLCRLEKLYTSTKSDSMKLKIIAEMNKLLGLYEQKIKIENVEYQLEI